MLLLLVGTSVAGKRKTTMGNKLLDIGECDSGTGICVIAEEEIDTILFQEVDTRPHDGKCDFIILFKKIIDPKRGSLWRYYGTQDCRPKI